MAFSVAFPTAKPAECIEFLDVRTDFPTANEIDWDDEMRVLQLYVLLVQACPPEFFVAVSERDRSKNAVAINKAHMFLPDAANGVPRRLHLLRLATSRIIYVCELLFKAWDDPTSFEYHLQLNQMLGVVTTLMSCDAFNSSNFAKAHSQQFSSIKYWQVLLDMGVEWADAMTELHWPEDGADMPPTSSLSIETPLIDWRLQRLLFVSINSYRYGHYSNARKMFTQAKYEYDWTPPDLYARFLRAPTELYPDIRIVADKTPASATSPTATKAPRLSAAAAEIARPEEVARVRVGVHPKMCLKYFFPHDPPSSLYGVKLPA
jgi:hypothetical protein